MIRICWLAAWEQLVLLAVGLLTFSCRLFYDVYTLLLANSERERMRKGGTGGKKREGMLQIGR